MTRIDEIPKEFLDERNQESFVIETDNLGWLKSELVNYKLTDFGDDPALEPVRGQFSLEEFLSFTKQLIEYVNEFEDKASGISFIEEYPHEEMHKYGNEVITYKIKSRKPASLSPDGSDYKQLRDQYQRRVILPNDPNTVYIVTERHIDHVIEFSAWSKSARLANARQLWLERLFVDNAWAYKVKGTNRIYWQGNGISVYHQVHGQRLYQRPVDIFVRLVEYRVIAEKAIRHIQYNVSVNKEA